MQFFAPEQHSLDQIEHLRALLRSEARTNRDDFFLASELVKHGHGSAGPYLKALKSSTTHPQALAFIARLENTLRETARIKNLQSTLADVPLLEILYRKEGFHLFPGGSNGRRLVVVFTTMYNNFGISNAVFYAMIHQMGVSTLFLKDTTIFNFMNGVQGLGGNLHELAENIVKLINDNAFERVYLLGYSSSAYASLFASYLVPCHGYLGFSPVTDLSPGAKCEEPKLFTADLRQRIDPGELIDLRDYAERHPDKVKRTLYFGTNSISDTNHAKHMSGLPGYDIRRVSRVGHATVDHLLAQGKLDRILRQLFLGA